MASIVYVEALADKLGNQTVAPVLAVAYRPHGEPSRSQLSPVVISTAHIPVFSDHLHAFGGISWTYMAAFFSGRFVALSLNVSGLLS